MSPLKGQEDAYMRAAAHVEAEFFEFGAEWIRMRVRRSLSLTRIHDRAGRIRSLAITHARLLFLQRLAEAATGS